jgi:S-formylglutathione hydrolase
MGTGFYLDATAEPWARLPHAGLRDEELPVLIEAAFPADPAAHGIFGHSRQAED